MFCDLFAAPSFAHAAPEVLNNPSGPLTPGFWLHGQYLLRPARYCHPASAGTAQDSGVRADRRRCYHTGAAAGRRARLRGDHRNRLRNRGSTRAHGSSQSSTCCKVSNLTAARTRLPTSAADHLQRLRAATAPPNRASGRPGPRRPAAPHSTALTTSRSVPDRTHPKGSALDER
jgi:hypothetical protein